MPGLNGTGPMGQGPATGRGFGDCVQERPINDGRGRGRGMGRGVGFGRSFRAGRRFHGFPPYAYAAHPYQYEITPEDEIAYLKEHAAYLEKEIKEIHNRISSLKKEETPES